MANYSRDRATFCARRGPRAHKNGPSSIISKDLNSMTSKNSWSSPQPNRAMLIKWLKKCPTTVRSFLSIFDKYKIFAKVPHPIVKFDEKHDDEVAGSCMANHSLVSPKFCPKMGTRAPKNCPSYSLQIPIIIQIDSIQPPQLFVG